MNNVGAGAKHKKNVKKKKDWMFEAIRYLRAHAILRFLSFFFLKYFTIQLVSRLTEIPKNKFLR